MTYKQYYEDFFKVYGYEEFENVSSVVKINVLSYHYLVVLMNLCL